ncbi:site-specific DNA-methyltransferase [Mycoplasmopsis felis]|uniref:DNA methyltransferase n=2 Tax=Mycoplasmopsis felis TaxID=33923 RepID=UPI0021DFFE48|nr:site-specific DNA-methyltransferase [Mycoplasmopsis felis]MCU9937870.1 site-specific DNA-methyltransferase [Mycoplasmopsis felis]
MDPPYNTGNDSFNYNDSFNHSTWLVFMKNRLELARRLLSEDGVIFVQCDDNEQAYLKVLMDDIFGRQNTETLIWNKEAENKSGTLKQVKRFRSINLIYKYLL